jgi:hypothetical protein
LIRRGGPWTLISVVGEQITNTKITSFSIQGFEPGLCTYEAATRCQDHFLVHSLSVLCAKIMNPAPLEEPVSFVI